MWKVHVDGHRKFRVGRDKRSKGVKFKIQGFFLVQYNGGCAGAKL